MCARYSHDECEAGAIGLVGGVIACLISAIGSMIGINMASLGGFSIENIGKAIMGGDDDLAFR